MEDPSITALVATIARLAKDCGVDPEPLREPLCGVLEATLEKLDELDRREVLFAKLFVMLELRSSLVELYPNPERFDELWIGICRIFDECKADLHQ